MNCDASPQGIVNRKFEGSRLYQVLPFRQLIVGVAWITVAAMVVLNIGKNVSDLAVTARYAVLLVTGIFLIVTWKPVWRFAWAKLRFLRDWFPDLNGTYDVELQPNWPIQKRILDAAAGKSGPFDPTHPDTALPPLGSVKLKARIDMGFYDVRMTMWSEQHENGQVIIDRSRTLSTTLVRPCDGHPHRLVYTYQQVNRRERIAPTDDTSFEGSAVLAIQDVDSGVLRGQYWTDRGWHRGLGGAGNIILSRIVG